MLKVPVLFLLITLGALSLSAQGGYHFGTKGGLTLANQNWNGGERRPLLVYHGNVFIESRDPEGKGSLFAQIGYHQRGSSIGLTNLSRSNDLGFQFNNISLLAGAKKRVNSDVITFGVPYFMLGIRGEYTVSNNLLKMRRFYENLINSQPVGSNLPTSFLVEPAFANKWLYGISLGGGFEFEGSEFFNAAIEFTFSQDLSFQYNQLPNNVNASARQIKNQSFEISLVLRFLREVIYE